MTNISICLRSIIVTLLLVSVATAQDASETTKMLRLLNTDIFHKTAETPVVLLERKKPNLIDPLTVMVDLQNGKYYAATIRYPGDIGFDGACRSIDQKYRKWALPGFADSKKMGLWRNEDEWFAIQMVMKKKKNEIQVIYIAITDEDGNAYRPEVKPSAAAESSKPPR